MIVYKIVVNSRVDGDVSVVPLGNRYYALYEPNVIEVHTDIGVFVFAFKAKFVINYRSGGKLLDFFIDQIGNSAAQKGYLLHDACYTPCFALGGEHPLSRELADDLLKAILIYSGMPKWKASLVHKSVRLFGRSAYEDDDELTEKNSKLHMFIWRDK